MTKLSHPGDLIFKKKKKMGEGRGERQVGGKEYDLFLCSVLLHLLKFIRLPNYGGR